MLSLVLIPVLSIILGYAVFLGLLFLLPRKLRSENNFQKRLIMREAKQKAETIRQEELQRNESKILSAREELESTILDRTSDLQAADGDLNSRQQYLDQEESRIQKREKDFEAVRSKTEKAREELNQQKLLLSEEQEKLTNRLATIADETRESVKLTLVQDRIQKCQITTAKHMKVVAEELSTNVQRLAGRMLARTNSRYAPEFIWPKGINHVEIEDPRLGEKLVAPETTLLADLAELTEGVNLSFVPPERPEHKPIIRLGGGFGIYKEAAKLTLEEILPRGPQHWGRLKEVYSKHRGHLEQSAAQLGRRALIDLKLDGMHIEILKMVGALNWRTSYRQNQYYHSIEVSKLAGLLAAELGVDPDAAKRCGLLHDIGKSIDYRIEGSHAVISGDYADRFGESKLICDTVMSHHADLLVETPLAYVLMTADTLSGARPGARVNLEEGYQDRLTSIQDVVRAFPGVVKVEIMNGAREVHVEVNHKKIRENELEVLSQNIARQIEEHVTYPGQIKILVTRRFESVAVA